MAPPVRPRADWQVEPTALQAKAVASATRLRILRLCNDQSLTNKALADRLGLDPSTVHRHVRLLVEAGLLASDGVRQGVSGAYEKPYRSTGLSWRLSFGRTIEDETSPGEPAAMTAFRAELAEAGLDSIAEITRFQLHLTEDSLADFVDEFIALVRRYLADDDAVPGGVAYGGIFVLHELARDDGAGRSTEGH